MVLLGWDPAKGCHFLSVYLSLNIFTKICMPPQGYLPNPCPMGAVDSRVICSVGVGRVAAARVLPGLLRLSPDKDLAGGVRFVPFALRGLGLGVVLVLLVLPWLTSLALLGVVVPVAQTARAQL